MSKKTVVILVGHRGVGKTTYRHRVLPDFVAVEAPGGDETALHQALQTCDKVVVDDRNPTQNDRENLILIARHHQARVEIHMVEPDREVMTSGAGIVRMQPPTNTEDVDAVIMARRIPSGYRVRQHETVPRDMPPVVPTMTG